MNLYTELISFPITQHPCFKIPRYDWGVIRGHRVEIEDYSGKSVGWYEIPEDRSNWRPEWDGKSMEDFWDYEKNDWKDECPKQLKGIKWFLSQLSRI